MGDWITFEIESPFIVIPKAVIIRNYPYFYGLKSIALSLSVDGDEFEDFAVLNDIHQDNNEEQYLKLKNVMLSNAKMWMNRYKFIRLTVISNWVKGKSIFYSFSLIGFEYDSN